MKAEEIYSIEKLFETIDRAEFTIKGNGKPIIGVSANLLTGENSAVRFAYTQSLLKSGAIPGILPI